MAEFLSSWGALLVALAALAVALQAMRMAARTSLYLQQSDHVAVEAARQGLPGMWAQRDPRNPKIIHTQPPSEHGAKPHGRGWHWVTAKERIG